jgi:hypothetical protein
MEPVYFVLFGHILNVLATPDEMIYIMNELYFRGLKLDYLGTFSPFPG